MCGVLYARKVERAWCTVCWEGKENVVLYAWKTEKCGALHARNVESLWCIVC